MEEEETPDHIVFGSKNVRRVKDERGKEVGQLGCAGIKGVGENVRTRESGSESDGEVL